MSVEQTQHLEANISFEDFQKEVLSDYKLAWESRQTSLYGRKEVLRGKAKFGIMGAGKELAQIALSKFFNNGDFRAGYYRDQTLAMATGAVTIQQQFSLLYADSNLAHEPASGGRQMSSHFATRLLDEQGKWKSHLAQKNHSADAAPTASQMGRAVGLALASKLYRAAGDSLKNFNLFSNQGNEVVFATIGDASTSEGIFLEAINAAGVQQIPVVFNVWDDGYGISVPKEYQTTKASISESLAGYQKEEDTNGLEIFTVKGWDYTALIQTYQKAVHLARTKHIPVLVHVQEITQPQGHSTSGSHERYKTEDRLQYEKEYDCLEQFKKWILANGIANEEQLDEIKDNAESLVKAEVKRAWDIRFKPTLKDIEEITAQLSEIENNQFVNSTVEKLKKLKNPQRSQIDSILRDLRIEVRRESIELKETIQSIYEFFREKVEDIYNSNLFPESDESAFDIEENPAVFSEDASEINGYEILNKTFDHIFKTRPEVFAFGEDLGKIGGVNQAFAGLQEKYGENRIFDTGIREGTIMGQAIGMAMRGLRPIAEIQYLDYMLYGIQQLSDEVSTLSYRTAGGQKCPVLIRTRGHRLEGIWHSGSPMGMIINAVRGMHVAVPRNMTQAAGFYNTFLQCDEPAMVIEPLNGYRLKEKLPENLTDFNVPIGKVEVLKKGTDITLVTYGSCVRVAEEAIQKLDQLGISVELIDVQTLLPFDLSADIVESLKKTNRVVFLDEDVPGGASAYMLDNVLVKQGGYRFLDSEPLTITSTNHRPGYGSEHNHFSKPIPNDIVDQIYMLMHEVNPSAFPALF